MPISLGRLRVYVGPQTLGGPDNLEGAIIEFIDGAREKLLVAVQELESRPIAEAIIRAKQRGASVRLILESQYLGVDQAVHDPWSEAGQNEENRQIMGAILRSDISVAIDLNAETFHQKFIVRDPDGSRCAVLTGSTNFTPTGTTVNLNHVVVLQSKRIASLYVDEFEEAWTGTFGEAQQRHDPEPRAYRISKVSVKVLFAPDHTPELEIMKQMLKAEHRVDFAMFTFAKSSGIDDTMVCLHRSGKPVRGVLDRCQANQRWAATHLIASSGAELWWPRTDSGVRKVHHKLAVIDESVVIAGSFNYTGTANRMNDENILVIGDMSESDPDALNRQRAVARYALDEIDRIITTQSERIPV